MKKDTTAKTLKKTPKKKQLKLTPEQLKKNRETRAMRQKKLRQTAFIKAFPVHNFNVARTCATLGFERQIFYDWQKNDPEFLAAMESSKNCKIDLWEEGLHNKIVEEKDTTAIIFGLKTLGKDRGYVEGNRVSVVDKSPVLLKVLDAITDGSMTADEAALALTKAAIPLPEIIRVMIGRQTAETSEEHESVTPEKLEMLYLDRIADIDRQLEMLPKRREQVEELKESVIG